MPELQETPVSKTDAAQTGWKSFFYDLMDLVESVLISVLVVLLVFTFLFKVATVEGDSMVPTLENGDRLIVSDLGYTPKNGDVIIVAARSSNLLDAEHHVVVGEGLNKRIVKRVIAQAGQTVDIDFAEGTVSVDGVTLQEPYVNTPTNTNAGAFNFPLTVPEGYLFVLGDNRAISKDSRHPAVGLIPTEDIVGKVVWRVFPFSQFGGVQ